MSVAAETPQLANAELWARARAMFTRALLALGPLTRLAAFGQLPAPRRRCALGWIALLEHVVRKLLLAQAMTRADAHLSAKQIAIRETRALSVAAPSKAAFDPSNPQTWAARFSFGLPRDERALPEHRAPRIRALWGDTPAPPPPRPELQRVVDPNRDGFRLARRLEAVRRVLQSPLPHAQRLARLLRRAVRRFPEIIHRYAYACARTNFYDPSDPRLSLHVFEPVMAAPICFSDSS